MNMPGFTADTLLVARKPFGGSFPRSRSVHASRGVSPAMINRGGYNCDDLCGDDDDCLSFCRSETSGGGGGGGGGTGGCQVGCGPCQMISGKYQKACIHPNCSVSYISCGRVITRPPLHLR